MLSAERRNEFLSLSLNEMQNTAAVDTSFREPELWEIITQRCFPGAFIDSEESDIFLLFQKMYVDVVQKGGKYYEKQYGTHKPDLLFKDREFALLQSQKGKPTWHPKEIDSSHWNDPLFVSIAVTNHGDDLVYTSAQMRNNAAILLLALTDNTYLGGYYPKNQILNYANIRKNQDAFIRISDIDNILERRQACAQLFQDMYFYADNEEDNQKLALELAQQYPPVIQFFSDEHLTDEVVQKAVSHYGRTIQYATEQQKQNKHHAALSVVDDPIAFKYIDNSLKNDELLIQLANTPDKASRQSLYLHTKWTKSARKTVDNENSKNTNTHSDGFFSNNERVQICEADTNMTSCLRR